VGCSRRRRGAAASPALVALVGTGFCGALTTYSTFGYETVQLAVGGSRLFAVFYALGSVLAGLGAAGLGRAVGERQKRNWPTV
jgi:CrcB protein